MNKSEVKKVLDYLELNYSDFKVTKDLFDMWLDELQQYDYEDVMNKLKQMLGTGRYINTPPVLVSITNGLTAKNKKLDWKKQVVMCHICGKAFNCNKDYSCPELKEHEDRCASIRYVIKQTKKWFNKDISRAELWAMSKEEFDERYDKLLHYIYEHTDNKDEKDVIGYIFNPPSPEVARRFFNNMGSN